MNEGDSLHFEPPTEVEPEANGATGSATMEGLPNVARVSRRWLVVTVAILVVLASGVGGYWVFYHGTASTTSGPGGTVSRPTVVNVTGVHLTGLSVNVSVVGGSGIVTNVTPGGSFNVSADLVQDCGSYGCSSEVRSASVDAPFVLLGSAPTLPYNWTASSVLLITLTIRAPSTPGNYSLNGTVSALPPPSPVTITALSFHTNYSGADSGYLSLSAPALPLQVKANSTFSLTLELASSSWYPEAVSGLTVASPFHLSYTSVTFPIGLAANGTLSVPMSILAPAAGNYSLEGTVQMAPTPVVTLGNVSWAITYYVDPYFSIAPTFGATPGVLHLGQKFSLDMRISNSDSQSHIYEVTAIDANWTPLSSSPWTLLSSSPAGNVSVPAGGSVDWVLTIQAPSAVGYYNLIVHISNWS